MARKPETNFRKRVREDLETLPNTVIMSIQQRSILGDPDLICCINGHFVALELKSLTGEASVLQNHKLERIRNVGLGRAYKVKPGDWDHIFLALNLLAKGQHL